MQIALANCFSPVELNHDAHGAKIIIGKLVDKVVQLAA